MAAGAYSGPIQLKAPLRKAINTGAGQQLTSTGPVHGVIVKAICPGQKVYVGDATVTTANGYPLGDGETLTLEVKNANQIYMTADADAQAVSILPFLRASVV